MGYTSFTEGSKAKQADEIDQLFDKLIKGKSPEEILGKNGLIKQLTKRAAQQALQGEITEHLGYEKNAPEDRKSGNSRNGSSRKRVIADSGEIDIEIPRDWNGDFEPQLIRKGQRRLPGFDERVIALSRGMTTRETRIVYLDAIHLKLRSSGTVQNHAVYVALGIKQDGQKELLGLWVGEAEGARTFGSTC